MKEEQRKKLEELRKINKKKQELERQRKQNLLFMKQLESNGMNIQMNSRTRVLLQIKDDLDQAMQQDMHDSSELIKNKFGETQMMSKE